MPNVVFGETSGSHIQLEHGLQAQKHFKKHNSEAGHESLKNYIGRLSSWTCSQQVSEVSAGVGENLVGW